MARTKQNQRSANRVIVPMGATGGRVPPSKVTVALLSTSVISAVWAGAMLTPPGRIAYYYLFIYSEFYMGVLSLVALSITVMLGLVATERMILSVRQRVFMQSAHRTTGVIAVFALVVHVLTKLSSGHIAVIDIFIPFLAGNQTVYIGLGTIAGFFMVSVLWTGIVRARFAGRGKPWMWRSLHSVAYLSWPIALVHGLSAGRAAASWVIVSYIVCVLLVLVALAVRLSVSLGRRKDFASGSTSSMKPVGKVVPTASQASKSRRKRRVEVAVQPISAHVVADRGNFPGAVVDTWGPIADVGPVAPVTARPAPDYSAEDQYRPPRRARRDTGEYAEPRRSYVEPETRYLDEQPEPRRRYVEDEPVAPPGRRYVEPEARFDDVPAQRSRRRYAEDDEQAPPRGRQFEEEDRYEPPRRRRSAEPEPRRAAPPPQRYAADEPVGPRGRSSELERYEPPRGRPRYPEPEAPVAPRGGRYAESSSRYEERPARAAGIPGPRPSRYVDDGEPAPRSARGGRRARPGPSGFSDGPGPSGFTDRSGSGGFTDRSGSGGFSDRSGGFSDSGRHSRAGRSEPSERWGAETGVDPNYLPPDDTPTLIDMATRRARRTADAPRAAGRGDRRRGGRAEETSDELYFRQLRGEAR